MTVLAGEWAKSKFITVDERGWHCDPDAPDEIRNAYEEFMRMLSSDVKIEDDEEE